MIKVNNNKYTSDKANPVVIICMDGTSFDYYEGAREGHAKFMAND